MRSWRLLTAMVVGVLLGSAAHAQQPQDAAAGRIEPPSAVTSSAPRSLASGLQQRNTRYRLRKGDSFDVEFTFSPEFNQSVAVQPDGYVTLKGIGGVHADGETIPDLTEGLRKAYSSILHDPVITILLKDFAKPYFIAAGQVARPGKYDIRSDISVVQAVAIAGGFTPAAKHSQVVLFRPISESMYETRVLNIKKMLSHRDLVEDVYLHPGDMVYVPQNVVSKIQRFVPAQYVSVNPTQF